jgi:hypothetical protein
MRNGITLITSFNRNILKFILILILTAFIGHGCSRSGPDDSSVPTRPNNCYFENPGPSRNDDGILKSSYWITNKCDLDTLSGYTKVVGDLTIRSNSLMSLTGIESLASVGGRIIITDNAILTSLEGLEGLTSVGGDLEIAGNDGLTNLEGLENVTSVGGDLEIRGNADLTNLEGLENVTSVGGDLGIIGNAGLTSLKGLENLTFVGQMNIGYNNSLTNLQSLENLTSVGRNFDIFKNIALTSLELNRLNHVGDSFSISGNQELCTSLAEDLKAQVEAGKGIGGYEFIYDNKPDC